MNRIKSIDGLRAVSILLVLLSHLIVTLPVDLSKHFFYPIIENGGTGVIIFFVISGYLITKLLIIEHQKTGDVNIKHFYIRRVFRIFPIFYTYILVIIVLKLFFVPEIFGNYKTVGVASIYLWNYSQLFHLRPDRMGSWFIGHFWSLSMEEQFYLLWPITFALVANKQKLIKITLVIILLMPLLRVATYFVFPGSRPQIGGMLQTGGDAILTGCLGAMLESRPDFKEKYGKYFQSNWLAGLSAFFLLFISPLLADHFRGLYTLPLGKTLEDVAIIILLFWSMYVDTPVSKALNNKLVMQLGILSYSLYVWQQLFLTSVSHFWINKFPQNIIAVFVVALISYNLIEKPILKLKKRFKDV
ncbi:acyltransferase [Mucilaginibacter sp. L196]|uniref:acyltransferase family protein n=1 Tax=Mucilaginibacter sp. L196 TaxID=1641870 RepID=UPI00131B9C4E|nr:acyltransferase [Mucilaginibacter sp. L196]